MTRPYKLYLWLSAAVLLVGAWLRFVNLDLWPVFADESIYVRWSQVMRAEPSLRFLPLTDGKQPLFMWLTIPFFKAVSDPLVAGRTVSAISGLGSVVGIAVSGLILFRSRRLALISALIWSVLPYSVFFNRMALVDSLLTMFIIWGFNLAVLAFMHLRLDMALLAGFCFGFAWLTKSSAMFGLALLPVLWVLRARPIHLIKLIFLTVVIYVLSYGIYNILRLGPQFHMIALRNQDYVWPLAEVLRHPLDPLVPHIRDSIEFFIYLLTPAGLLFAIWGLSAGKLSHHLRLRLVLGFWWLAPVIFQSFIARGFTARYLLFTVPFAVLLITRALDRIGSRTRGHFLTLAAASLVVLPAVIMDYLILSHPVLAPLPRIERSGYLEDWTAGTGIKDISTRIRSAAASGPVVVGSEGYFGTPFDALQLYLNDLPQVRVVGVGVWIDSVPDKLATATGDNQVFLVVNSDRFHVSRPEEIGLKLIAAYPKAVSADGSREELLFFEVVKP